MLDAESLYSRAVAEAQAGRLGPASRLLERARRAASDPDLAARIELSSAYVDSERGDPAGGRRRYRALDLKWIVICTKLRATGMPIRGIHRYAELVAAGPGNEKERLALLESHRADVLAKLRELGVTP